MTTEYIRYNLGEHSAEEFVAAYERAAEHLRNSPECLGYELQQCEEEPQRFILRIDWTSTEAHLEGFRKGPNFRPFLAQIRSFIDEIEEMQHYESTSIQWVRS